MKRSIYVTQKSMIKRSGNTLRVTTEENNITVPLSVISGLYIFGKSSLSTGARNFLLRNGIDIYFLSSSGALHGILSNTKLRSNYRNRLKQYSAFESRRIDIARLFVLKKIEEIAVVAGRSMQRYSELAKSSDTLDSLMGIEGSATLYMFEKIRSELTEIGIEFGARSYHPPKDEVNSLLSFVYTLHYTYIYSLLLSRGLDPYIGFLHHKRGKHAALVSDVMESQRVQLTRFVADLFLEGRIGKDDFEKKYRIGSHKMRDVIRGYMEGFVGESENAQKMESFISYIVEEL